MTLFCDLQDPANCDTHSWLSQLRDRLCLAECLWDEMKCVECGTPPPYNYLWDECVGDTPCGSMVLETCETPVLWVYDGDDWHRVGHDNEVRIGRTANFDDCANPRRAELSALFNGGVPAQHALVIMRCDNDSMYYTFTYGNNWFKIAGSGGVGAVDYDIQRNDVGIYGTQNFLSGGFINNSGVVALYTNGISGSFPIEVGDLILVELEFGYRVLTFASGSGPKDAVKLRLQFTGAVSAPRTYYNDRAMSNGANIHASYQFRATAASNLWMQLQGDWSFSVGAVGWSWEWAIYRSSVTVIRG